MTHGKFLYCTEIYYISLRDLKLNKIVIENLNKNFNPPLNPIRKMALIKLPGLQHTCVIPK